MRIVAVSDTHKYYDHLEVPDGDVFVHAGDIEVEQGMSELLHLKKWLTKLPHKYKIVIAGNHDFLFQQARDLVTRELKDVCTYLENEETIIQGVKFWASPYTPRFGSWAFMKERGDAISRVWNLIPDKVDVLITHGPPMGILDVVNIGRNKGESQGCFDLMRAVKRVKPKVHIFGHIHEGHGHIEKDGTKFYNVAVLDENYDLIHKPTVIDI